MNKITNIKEAKNLVITYRGVSLKQIIRYWNYIGPCPHDPSFITMSTAATVMNHITGFGSAYRCSLCRAVAKREQGCSSCIYSITMDSEAKGVYCSTQDTYIKIHKASTPRKLYYAINQRAGFIENLIKQYENRNESRG